VGRPLTCPACTAEFSFDDWARTARCPRCGSRVDFAAASGAGGAVTAARASGERLHVFGKPLALTRGWIAVFAVWAVVAAVLGAARLEMGRLPVLTARERAAISAVEKAHMGDGTTFARALALARRTYDPVALPGEGALGALAQSAPARWYVIDRPWEHTVYVAWELTDPASGSVLRLVWTVHGNAVRADAASYALLEQVVRSAHQSTRGTTSSPVVLPDPDASATAEPSPTVP
jgi:hypothetical protein